MVEDTMLTVDEVADELSVSVPTVHRWRREQRLPPPAPQPGRRLRWSKKVLSAWKAAGFCVDVERWNMELIAVAAAIRFLKTYKTGRELPADVLATIDTGIAFLSDSNNPLPERLANVAELLSIMEPEMSPKRKDKS